MKFSALLLLPALVLGVSLDARANLDVGHVLSAKSVKANAAGTLYLTTRFGAASADVARTAVVISDLTSVSGPAPLASPIIGTLVWTDPQTGTMAFSSALAFEGDAFDKDYTVVSRWYDAAGNLLGSDERVLTVERRGPPPITLDVLNPPNAYGDVIVTRGDFVQVNYTVGCDFDLNLD